MKKFIPLSDESMQDLWESMKIIIWILCGYVSLRLSMYGAIVDSLYQAFEIESTVSTKFGIKLNFDSFWFDVPILIWLFCTGARIFHKIES